MQIFALLQKRTIIFLRNPLAEIAFFLIPIIACIACNGFLSSAESTTTCAVNSRFSKQKYTPLTFDAPLDLPFSNRQDFIDSSAGYEAFVTGQAPWGVGPENGDLQNVTRILNESILVGLQFVNNFDEWYKYIQTNFSIVKPGGISLIENPSIAYQADSDGGVYNGPIVLNLFTNLILNGTLSVVTNFSPFQISWVDSTTNILQYIAYVGLAVSVAPCFTGLYPTFERLSKVRAMQYSNGLRVFPLWTAYILFDLLLIIILSGITLGVMNSGIDGLNGPGYLFFTLFLFFTASVLQSFIMSLFVQSQLAAFAVMAAYQAVSILVYLIGYLTTQSFGSPMTMDSTIRVIYFTIGVVSPAQSLMRALFVAFNIFGILCTSGEPITYMGHILAYGAPILYLILQCVAFFAFLIWWDGGQHAHIQVVVTKFIKKRARFYGKFFKKIVVWRKKKQDEKLTEDPLDRFNNVNEGDPEKTQDVVDSSAANKIAEEVLEEEREIENHLNHYEDGLALSKTAKQFGEKYVVDSISFGVHKGECFALLGPNGAGKTTTFNMIRGEMIPTAGDIYVTGISVTQQRGLARTKLGVCPQFDAMDKLTVVEVLKFYASLRGISGGRKQIQRHVDQLIMAVDLERFRTRMASKLSGGNKRKLSLAVALIGNPDVLLLDEPSSGMDAFAKRIMWRTLADFAPGRAIVLTTHSMEEADALANRAGILAHRMLALGNVDKLRRKYGDVFHVHLVCSDSPSTSPEEMQRVVNIIRQVFPGAVVEDRMYQGQIKMAVPTHSIVDSNALSFVSSPSGSASGSGSGSGSTDSSNHNANNKDTINELNEKNHNHLETQISINPQDDNYSQQQHQTSSSPRVSVSEIFQLLESHKLEMNLRSYSVFPTRLEEVFLKIVGGHIEEESM